jgi:hypothetical protein
MAELIPHGAMMLIIKKLEWALDNGAKQEIKVAKKRWWTKIKNAASH